MTQDTKDYDVIIIGGGPGGLAAAIYTARDKLRSLLLERGMTGGQIATAEVVENYPGFPEGISGMDLTELMRKQAERFGLEIALADVGSIAPHKGGVTVTSDKGEYTTRAVIIATGSERRKLGVKGEEELKGRGVAYCATCDAAFFRDVPVAVVGGGDAAITEALHLTGFASKVTIIHRRNRLRASRGLQDTVLKHPKIDVLWDSVVESIEGKDRVEGATIVNVVTDERSHIKLSGVFVSVGLIPNTAFLKGTLKLDEAGYIVTDSKMETEIPGVYAVGDVRQGSARQAICAAGDGATAAVWIKKSLAE